MSGALLLGLVLAQAVPAGAPDASQLERIRKALAEQPAIAVSPGPPKRDGVVFRVTVRGWAPDRPAWDDWASVPSYIRPAMPAAHYDFLQQVTPEAFRASTLYPGMSLPVGTFIEWLAKGFASENRKTRQERAREEVRKALEAVLACRADPSRPGC